MTLQLMRGAAPVPPKPNTEAQDYAKNSIAMSIVTVSVQGCLLANFSIAPDVLTQTWLRSGMTLQLMRSAAAVPPNLSTEAQDRPAEGLESAIRAASDKPLCIARGVLQADALLDGVTREKTMTVHLQTAVPLFAENNVRLGLEDPGIKTKQVVH